MKAVFTRFFSVLKANTPPSEKRYSSRKFLSLFLILFLAVGNVWAELTAHTPGIYEKAADKGGFGIDLTTYAGNQYEVYYFSANNKYGNTCTGASKQQYRLMAADSDSEHILFSDASQTAPWAKNCGWIETNFATTGFAKSDYTYGTKTFNEFFAITPNGGNSSNNKTCYIKPKNGDILTLKVSGYVEFAILGADNGTSKYMTITVDGGTPTSWKSNTLSRRSVELTTGEHTIVVANVGTSQNSFYGFSLKLPSCDDANASIIANTSVYVNDELDLEFSSDNTNSVVYDIKKGGTATSDASVTAGVFKATVAGTYVVTATQAKDASGHCAVEESVTIIVNSKTPVSSVSISGDATAYIGIAKTLTATADQAVSEYKWEVDGVDQGVNAASFNFSAAAAGTYSVVCKARNSFNDPGEYIASSAHSITVTKLCGELIRATRNGKNIDPVTGVVGGTATKNTQDGGKLGSSGHYWKLVLASGNFMPGDVVTVNVSTAAGQGTLAITTDQAGTNVVATAGGVGIVGNNDLTITEAVGNTIWLSRDGTNNTWNGVVDAIFVTRSCETSTDCEIKSLTINGETITPSAKVYSYEVAAASALTEVAVAYTIHPLATGTPASGFSVAVPAAGDPANTQTITVTAEDGTTSDTYTVSVTKAASASDVVTLDALGVTGYTLDPAFDAGTLAYTITKAYGAEDPGTDKVTFTKTETEQTVDVAYDGTNHKFVVTVTAEDNTTTQDYVITINEAEAPKSLSRVLFSNGFDAFIDNTNHTVKAYYLDGTAAPTATTITAGAGTAGELAEGKITVTGEDASTVDYIVTLEAVTPNTTAVAEADPSGEFAGDEAWVKNGLLVYGNAEGYSAGDKWYVNRRLLKSSDAADDQRVIAGWVRSYFFVGNAYKFIMTVSNNTAIKYSIDGGEQVANNAATVEITLPAGNHMIEIVSNQSNGDCRLSAPKLVERPATYSVTYKAGEGTGDDVIDAFEYAAGDEVTVQANAFTAPANKKFNGWASAPAVTISEGKFEMPASNVVLTAQWKEYFTITYKDGETIIGTEEVFTDATPAGIANPSKIDYDFAGWVDGENSPVTIANLSATTTVYAKWTADPCPDKKSVVKVVMTSTSTATVTGYNANEYAGGYIINNLADGDNAFAYDFGEGSVTGYKLKGSGSAIFATLAKGGFEAGDKVVFAVTQKAGDNKLAVYAAKDKNNVLKLAEIDVADAGIYEYKLKAADIAAIEAAGADYKSIGSYRGDYNPYIYSVELKGCRSWAVFHTLTFKNIDGTATIAAESLEEGACASTVAPAAPKIPLKRFLGWAEAVNGTPVDLTSYTIIEDKTLYAVYEDIVCPTTGTVYKFQLKTDLTNGNIFTSAPGELTLNTTDHLSSMVNGEVTVNLASGKNTNRVQFYDGKAIGFANGDGASITLTLDCALATGDEVRFINYAGSGNKMTLSDATHTQTLDGNGTEEVQTWEVPAAWAGATELTLVRGGNTPKLTYFEIYRRPVATGATLADLTIRQGQSKTPVMTLEPSDDARVTSQVWEIVGTPTNLTNAAIDPATGAITTGTLDDPASTGSISVKVTLNGSIEATCTATVVSNIDQQDVTKSTVWDWHTTGATANIQLTKDTDPKKNEGFVMANVAVKNDEDFESDKLYVEGEYIVRDYDKTNPYFQGQTIKFNTTVAGAVRVTFSHTGSDKPARELFINGVGTGTSVTGTSQTETGLIEVPAGEVAITAFHVNPTEGAGQQYVRVYKIEFLVPDYTRDNLNPTNIATICLPNGGIMTGATLYKMAGKNEYNKLCFDEVQDNIMVAGNPYLFVPENGNTKINVYYTDKLNVAAGNDNGLYGTYVRLSTVDDGQNSLLWGKYIISNNKYIYVDANNCNLAANRAYVVLNEVQPLQEQNPAPGLRRIVLGTNESQVATGVDQVQGDEVPTKMIINGQLFILRGEKMYDAQGKLVK